MKKKTHFFGWLTLIFLLTIFFMNFFSPDIKFSKEENRTMAQKPKMDAQGVWNGSYGSNYDAYMEDQFWNRSFWKRMKTKFEKTIGLKKIDNIYFGNDGRLIEEAVIPSEDFMKRRVENLKKFDTDYSKLNVQFLLIPNKIGIYYDEVGSKNLQEELYQKFTSNFREDLFKINPFEILKEHKKEKIFYDTDHHYTTLAARYLSESFYDKKDVTYEEYTVNDHFVGTSANKIAYYEHADTVSLYVPKEEISYYVTYDGEEKEYTTIYDDQKQYSNNPYEIFFGGNHGKIEIQTNAEKENKLLLIKDSYANSFLPFILSEYREIIVIDPRYYYENIDEVIKDKQITDILLLYNMNTFFEDTSFDDMVENIKE